MSAQTETPSTRKRQIFNISGHEKGGYSYFLIYLFIAAGMGYAVFADNSLLESLNRNPVYPYLRGFLLFSTFILSLISLVIAHLSYPRIHNLKILLLGYLTFVLHTFYILARISELMNPVIQSLSENNHFITLLIYNLLFFNFLVILGVPSFAKFRTSRGIVTMMVTFEIIIFLYIFLVITGNFSQPELELGTFGWVLPLIIASLLTVANYKLIYKEHNLWGALSGIAFIYAVSAAARLGCLPGSLAFITEEISFAITSLLIVAALTGNWLSRMSQRLYYDPLTQMYNREYCNSIIEERSSIVFTYPSSAAMFDIDFFKKINDTYGHAAGDRMLQYVAQCLMRELVPAGIVCRYGGEEITVFFPGKSLEEAKELCIAANKAIKSGHIMSGRRKITATISCGVAELNEETPDISDVLKIADKALYKAKDTGRDKVVVG